MKTTHATDEQLLLYLDRELSRRRSARLRTHFSECPSCLAKLTQIEKTSSAALALSAQSGLANPEARARFTASLAELARKQAYAPAATHLRLARSMALLSAAALLITLSIGVANRLPSNTMRRYAGLLPDPTFTPGSTRPVKLGDICSNDSDEVVRDVPALLQQKVFAEYGLRDQATADFEVDYLITPGLGGSDDVRNLWPEPHQNGTWNSYVKDQLEDHLHQMVCGRRLSLEEAQTAIATDWIAAYKKYFHTNQPLTNPADVTNHGSRSRASLPSLTASSLPRASLTAAARSVKHSFSSYRLSAATVVWIQ